MGWLNRRRSETVADVRERVQHVRDDITAAADEDSPQALRAAMTELDRFVNAHAGRLPAAAVVGARQITDVLRDVVDTSDVRPLDVYAVVSVRGIVSDYLPTTLRSYLAVDPTLLETPRAWVARPRSRSWNRSTRCAPRPRQPWRPPTIRTPTR